MSIAHDPTSTTLWHQLCGAFSADPALWAEVGTALSDPAAYLLAFGDRLANRGIESAEQVTAWIALVDWLDENDRLVELDWTSTSEDLVDYLSTLPMLAGADLSPVAAERVHLAFAVPRANLLLARGFHTLILLDIGSDSYPLALVSSEAAPRIGQLAAALGHVARPIDARDAGVQAQGAAGDYRLAPPIPPAVRVGPPPVNFGRRLLALVIDTVLLYGVILGSVALGVAANGGDGSGDSGVIGVVVLATIAAYLTALVIVVGRTGRSLGLLAMGLRLIGAHTGAAPGYAAAAGRGALMIGFVFWIWALTILITVLTDANGRGLHDKSAGTMLIDVRRAAA